MSFGGLRRISGMIGLATRITRENSVEYKLNITDADNIVATMLYGDFRDKKPLLDDIAERYLAISKDTYIFYDPLIRNRDKLRVYLSRVLLSDRNFDSEEFSELLPESMLSLNKAVLSKSILAFALYCPSDKDPGIVFENERGQALINLLNALKVFNHIDQ